MNYFRTQEELTAAGGNPGEYIGLPTEAELAAVRAAGWRLAHHKCTNAPLIACLFTKRFGGKCMEAPSVDAAFRFESAQSI